MQNIENNTLLKRLSSHIFCLLSHSFHSRINGHLNCLPRALSKLCNLGLGVYYLINDHVNECNNFARLKTHLRQFWHEFILTFFNWSLSNNSISNWFCINKDRFSLHLHLPINYLRKFLIFLDIPQNLSYILLILFEDFITKERNKLL